MISFTFLKYSTIDKLRDIIKMCDMKMILQSIILNPKICTCYTNIDYSISILCNGYTWLIRDTLSLICNDGYLRRCILY